MLRYMVLSDSHRAGGWLARAAEIYAQGGFDGCIHLGDVHADARRFAELAGTTPLCVRGNCDLAPLLRPGGARGGTGRRRGYCSAHGDRYGVKSSLTRLSYRAEELRLSGGVLRPHAPRRSAAMWAAALLLNPGALREGNWAEVTVQEGRIVPRLLSL